MHFLSASVCAVPADYLVIIIIWLCVFIDFGI